MKNWILSLLMLTFALNAKAGNEGAQATPVAPPSVLAEYVSHGGFFIPPGGVASTSYQILPDGTVQVVTWTRGQDAPEVKLIETLSNEELAHVKNLVAAVRPGKLFDPTPKSPGCMDAPSSSYVVYSSAGAITIGQYIDCKTLERENATAADTEIMKILSEIAKSDR